MCAGVYLFPIKPCSRCCQAALEIQKFMGTFTAKIKEGKKVFEYGLEFTLVLWWQGL